MTDKTDNNGRTVLGVDIGGSAIKFGLVDIAAGRPAGKTRTLEPSGNRPADLTEAVRECTAVFKWDGPIGIGYPGVVRNGVTHTAAHMDESFIGYNWLDDLKGLVAAPVSLINDADAAGLAEMRFGAAREMKHGTVLVLTLGTGIGSALFRNGLLYPNTELGHLVIGESEAEDQAAGSIKSGEKLSWDEYGRRLNRVLKEYHRLLCPDLIVLGGGISEDFAEFVRYLDVPSRVVAAGMKNEAGLIGAALATDPDIFIPR